MVLAFGASGPAVAATVTPQASTGGSVTFYADADPTADGYKITYVECAAPASHQLPRPMVAFDNQPAPGCQVVLVSSVQPNDTYTLCAGRGPIPAAFQVSPKVVVQAGKAAPCDIA